MPARQLRNFVFTLNNPPEDIIDLLKSWDDIKYCICQFEEVSTKHLQGYIELSRKVSFGKVAKRFGWHIEARRGTQQQAIDYSSKEESRIDGPFEWGEKANQGARHDVDRMYEMVRQGKREREIAEEMPSTHARCYRALDRYRFLVDKDETKAFRNVEVHIWWGKTGTGKSRAATEGTDWYKMVKPNNNTVWFDGYEGEKTLVIDEFYGWIPIYYLLELTDGHQMQLPIKGNFTWAKWDKVIITSNTRWRDWYDWSKVACEKVAAFERRITEIKEFK